MILVFVFKLQLLNVTVLVRNRSSVYGCINTGTPAAIFGSEQS